MSSPPAALYGIKSFVPVPLAGTSRSRPARDRAINRAINGSTTAAIPGATMELPRYFCWTRFGTEAGEDISDIVARKEEERLSNQGVFLWGIGNAVGRSMCELVRRERTPQLLFSPIRSAPRKQDVAPASVVIWTAGRTQAGDWYDLPTGSVVTSGMSNGSRASRRYALVCESSGPLRVEVGDQRLSFSHVRNLLTDRPLGASQVTAVVRLREGGKASGSGGYPVAMRANLVYPYVVELVDPLLLPRDFYCGRAAGRTRRDALLAFVAQSKSAQQADQHRLWLE